MVVLILGLVVFLGVHSIRIFADDWRTAQIAARGEKAWKGAYAAASIVGLGLIVWGYGLSRVTPVPLWDPPVWSRHLALLLMAVSFIVIAQMKGPVGIIKKTIRHPMLAAVMIWSIAHLLANGTLADLLLFGSFLVWAIIDFHAALRRDRVEGTVYADGPVKNDIVPGIVGLVIWLVFLLFLHQWLFGVSPLG